jgi:hypothetical protein
MSLAGVFRAIKLPEVPLLACKTLLLPDPSSVVWPCIVKFEAIKVPGGTNTMPPPAVYAAFRAF